MPASTRLVALAIALAVPTTDASAQDAPVALPLVKDVPALAGFGPAPVDIVGIRFGETRADTLAILAKAYPDARIEEPGVLVTLADSRNNKVTVELRQRAGLLVDDRMPQERITVGFTSPVTGGRVYRIERELTYSQYEPGDLASLRAAIAQKYGEPTLVERYDHQNRMEITYTWENRPVQRLGEQDVRRRGFGAPLPINQNRCLITAVSSAYDSSSGSKLYTFREPGTRKPDPGWEACVGAIQFVVFYGPNPQTVSRLLVVGTDYARSMVDGQLLDKTLHDLVQASATASRTSVPAPKL